MLAALKAIHEKNWKRLGVLEHFHQQNSCSHSGRPCDEFPRTSSLILSPLVGAGCSVRVTVSCDEYVGDAGEDELEELVD